MQINKSHDIMKNQYILILALITILFTSTLNAQVLEEGFESWPPSEWTLEPISGSGEWVQSDCDIPTTGGNAGPGEALEGGFAAMFNNYDYVPNVTGSMMTPAFDLSSLEVPMVHFFWWNNDAPLEPSRLVVQSSSDGISFSSLDTITCTGSGETNWIEYYHLLEANTTHIKIRGISDYGLKNTFVDVFSIMEAPSCLQPSNLTAYNIEATSANIEWTNGNDETAWTLEYGLAGFEQGNGTLIPISSHPYTIEDLSSNTNYEVYIQSDCDDEESPWAGPLAFTTICETITDLPWEEGFENGNLGCFAIQQSNPVETWYWTDETAFIGPYAGEGYARIAYSLSPQNEWMVSPVFDLSGYPNPSLIFHWSLSYTYSIDPNDNYDLFVRVTTDGENWTPIWDESMVGVFENWIYYEETLDLSTYQDEPYFQFAFNYVGTDGAAAYLDEILLDYQTGLSAQNSSKNNIVLFPNPSADFVNIQSEEGMQNISIYNMMGQLVLNKAISSETEVQLSTRFLDNGMYIVKVESLQGIETLDLSISK